MCLEDNCALSLVCKRNKIYKKEKEKYHGILIWSNRSGFTQWTRNHISYILFETLETRDWTGSRKYWSDPVGPIQFDFRVGPGLVAWLDGRIRYLHRWIVLRVHVSKTYTNYSFLDKVSPFSCFFFLFCCSLILCFCRQIICNELLIYEKGGGEKSFWYDFVRHTQRIWVHFSFENVNQNRYVIFIIFYYTFELAFCGSNSS